MSKRSYDRRVLDQICHKETMNMKIEDALATIINSITELTFKKISFFNSEKIVLVGGGRKNLTLKMFLNKVQRHIVITARN